MSYKRLQALAKTDPKIAARLDLFNHRVIEELYDVKNDPDCLHNLINSEEHQKDLASLRTQMEGFMKRSKDPMLDVFLNRDDESVRAAFMKQQQAEADERRSKRRKTKENNKGKGKNKKKAAA